MKIFLPTQNKNLENIFKCRVIDRSWLILEIFGNHARTRQAKTQVELASLKYALPRLTKMWGHLSRQRGGIGMKDVGETQIQLDRRLIRDKITKLARKIKTNRPRKKNSTKKPQGSLQSCSYWLYECRKIYSHEPIDRSKNFGGK